MVNQWCTLDKSFRRSQMIEGFESLLWTERYSDLGDFTIVVKSSSASRKLLTPETWITMLGSTYAGKIDTVDDKEDENGIRNLSVTGKMMEQILQDRVAMPAVADLTTVPGWTLTGKPADIARAMFQTICVTCVLSPLDTVPFYTPGTLITEGTLGEPQDIITVTFQPDTLFTSLQSLCSAYDLGFRLVRNGDKSQVYFEIYVGSDRSSNQSVLMPVIFDERFQTLSSPERLKSTALNKTVAYIYAQNGSAVVYAPNTDSTASGTDRRILFISSSNDGPAGAGLTQALTQEALVALASQQTIHSFDGELAPDSPYIYGRDYFLGDLVEEIDSDGISSLMLVTEQIFSTDNTGDRSYPTLALKETITPGSWAAWDSGSEWSQVSSGIHWGDLL